ncbi:MAG: hypothetical protein ACREN2_11660 [Candidatus Dormibacteria bacterium]
MTDFWPGQDPWSAFEQNPAWDGAGEPDGDPVSDPGDTETQTPTDATRGAIFVRDAIQRIYHP